MGEIYYPENAYPKERTLVGGGGGGGFSLFSRICIQGRTPLLCHLYTHSRARVEEIYLCVFCVYLMLNILGYSTVFPFLGVGVEGSTESSVFILWVKIEIV